MTSIVEWRQALKQICDVAGDFKDHWWVIGSAAARLAGAEINHVADIDLLLSERDARGLLQRWNAPPHEAAAPSDQFRSSIFARFSTTRPPIEIMAGFEMRVAGAWTPIIPETRMCVRGVFIPEIGEQITLLRLMGRTKDKARIEALEKLSASG